MQRFDGWRIFLSTPSARRATSTFFRCRAFFGNFYPRPPRGGRPVANGNARSDFLFLSTPSARRATNQGAHGVWHIVISIHALREEGDCFCFFCILAGNQFLSTPSARRATIHTDLELFGQVISIHALREEGDPTARPW